MGKILFIFLFLFHHSTWAYLPPEVQSFLDNTRIKTIAHPTRPELVNSYYYAPLAYYDAIVFLPGMGEFALKYHDLLKDFSSVSASIYFWDHIGQGNSTHLLPLESRKVHIDSFETYVDTLDNFLSGLKRKHSRIYVVGHSMGAHIALRVALKHPGLINKMVLSSPMIDVNRDKVPIHALSWLLEWLPQTWLPSLFTFFKKAQDPTTFLTKSNERIQERLQILRMYPQLERTAPTIGWLNASVKSINAFAGADWSSLNKTPILILQADQDILVSNTAQEEFCKKVSSCRLRKIPNSFHEIFFEADPARAAAISHTVQFLR